VVGGAAVGSKDLDTGQRGHGAGVHHKFYCYQLTCMTEPHAWEKQHLWGLYQNQIDLIEPSFHRLNF